MKELGALPNARVYLDAGNPGMFADPGQLAGPLEAAGVRYGRGFSANVSNFDWTAGVVTWSQQLERALGGTVGAVIDTSRNGRGPYTGPTAPQWCNPPGRALGPAPRLNPGPAGIDAYLWIKDPGASDGACSGGPAAGQYWPRTRRPWSRPATSSITRPADQTGRCARAGRERLLEPGEDVAQRAQLDVRGLGSGRVVLAEPPVNEPDERLGGQPQLGVTRRHRARRGGGQAHTVRPASSWK